MVGDNTKQKTRVQDCQQHLHGAILPLVDLSARGGGGMVGAAGDNAEQKTVRYKSYHVLYHMSN
jgi:hypothetical protein